MKGKRFEKNLHLLAFRYFNSLLASRDLVILINPSFYFISQIIFLTERAKEREIIFDRYGLLKLVDFSLKSCVFVYLIFFF